ncbi:MAG: hypothetical protein FWF80_02425 [Defluviitaleaceae bacterium]|nr:hypothetical protein [Defluviitaleaceae bacterium]
MINSALLGEQLKRFWAIPVISAVVFLLAVYLPAVRGDHWDSLRHVVDIISMRTFYMQLILVATPVVSAFCVFGSFFNKRAATVFYSIPLTKNQVFVTNAAAGIILCALPIVFFSGVLLLPLALNQGFLETHAAYAEAGLLRYRVENVFSPQYHLPHAILPNGWIADAPINTLPIIGGLFLRMLLTSVFYFGVAWLAFSLAGHGFTALVIVGALPFVPTIAMAMVDGTGVMYVFGYDSTTAFANQSLFLAYHNPAAWGTLLRGGALSHTQAVIIPVIIYIVLGAAIYAGAFFVSRARKPERVGTPVMFAPVKNVLVFLMSFSVMIFMGLMFLMIDYSVIMMHVGFVVGFAIGYAAAQMIAEKSFYIGGKLKFFAHFAGIAAAIYIAMLVATQFGLGFIINRVPSEDEIFGVYVTSGIWQGDILDEHWHRIVVSDPEFIAAAREAHQAILDGRRELHSLPNLHGASTYARISDDGTIYSREGIFFKYILHNGRTVTRHYSITGDFIAQSGLEEFLSRREFVLAPYVALRMPELIEGIGLHFDMPLPVTHDEDIVDSAVVTPTHIDNRDWRDVHITDREQMDIVLELVATSAVEAAAEARESRRHGYQPGHFGQSSERAMREWRAQQAAGFTVVPFPDDWVRPPSLHVSFFIDHADSNFWHHRWRAPFVQGEAVERIIALIDEWGLWYSDL